MFAKAQPIVCIKRKNVVSLRSEYSSIPRSAYPAIFLSNDFYALRD
jgi:hypothetical protein